MITSIMVGFDSLHITDKEAIESAEIFLKKYGQTVAAGKPKYMDRRTAKGIIRKFLCKVEERSSTQLLEKRVHLKDNKITLHHHHNKQLRIDKELNII